MSGILVNPSIEVKVGGTAIAVENIMDISLHLGCTKEVSSYEVVVNNSNVDYYPGEYSPGGAKEFTKGDAVTFKVKRGTITVGTNYLLTGILESLEFIDQAEEYQFRDIVILRGRCKGYQLYARKYDGDLNTDVGALYKSYKRVAGEAESLIAYFIDNYSTLSHTRVNSVATANAAKDQKVVAVTDGTKFAAGDLVKIYDTNNWEYNKVASVATNNVTMVNNLLQNYTTAATLTVYLDLIKDSNTTYSQMIFSHETIFDIIKFISDTASTSGGVIGYDSRIEYDGDFAWLPRGLVTESYSLAAQVQLERYLDDASRIKNKITVYGKADKPYPLDVDGQNYGDAWTEDYVMTSSPLSADAASGQPVVDVVNGAVFAADDEVLIISSGLGSEEIRIIDSISTNKLTMTENLSNAHTVAAHSIAWVISSTEGWGFIPSGASDSYSVVKTAAQHDTGSNSIKFTHEDSLQYSYARFYLRDGYEINMEDYPTLKFKMYFDTTKPTGFKVMLFNFNGTGEYTVTATSQMLTVPEVDKWVEYSLNCGTKNWTEWVNGYVTDWEKIRGIGIWVAYGAAGTHFWYIDRLHAVGEKRWGGGSNDAAVDGYAYDATSVATYGVREHVVVNDMLLSDKECEAKAQSLKAFYKNPRVTMELESNSLDWGNYPFIPGNKLAVDMTPIGIADDFRIDCIDVYCRAMDSTFTIVFTLDNTPPRRADYLYNLSKRLRQLEKNYRGIR